MTSTGLLIAALITGLIFAIGYLIARIVKGDDPGTELPLLTEVGVTASGLLTCPSCGSASFQRAPAGSSGFFALALGPFVFGALSSSSKHIIECVACDTRYRRGVGQYHRTETLAGL